jgi:hypothetical protein
MLMEMNVNCRSMRSLRDEMTNGDALKQAQLPQNGSIATGSIYKLNLL